MKTSKPILGQTSVAALLVATTTLLAVTMASLLAASPERLAPAGTARSGQSIPWSDIGAKATAQYSGDGLAVCAGENDAVRLRCVFQRLEGEVTSEGLWLTSTVEGAAADRFRVVADYVGRDSGVMVSLPERGVAGGEPGLGRYVRRGLVEEYSVSVDGVRQDFVVPEPPGGEGPLRVDLAVRGARTEAAANGARLVLSNSGRKLAYSRLRVVDARDRELGARLEVISDQRLAVEVEDADAVYPVRIDPTFSDENWVSLGGLPGTDGDVRAAVVDASGNLYIGGWFTVVGDVVANKIAKWDGSAWSALGSGMNYYVKALAVSGTNLYAGGEFTTAGGVSALRIAKWNGNAWSALGSGMDDTVYALAVSGTDLYAGGIFHRTADGHDMWDVAKWNGSTRSALGSGLNTPDYALAASGTDLYAGGYFIRAGGVAANKIAKWNGSAWSALGSGMGTDFFDWVGALAVSGTDLYAGGSFSRACGVTANTIAKWNGTAWSALGSGMDGQVNALAVSGTDLYA
ncbi:MAG: hypothetical protein NT154_34780, partial [Verrucomicrobia bacterium]|nr:hypothetical protein [Verrucomicrobiota bacterium]